MNGLYTRDAPPIKKPVLTLSEVTVHLGDKPILRDISLNVEHGRLMGIIGPNGSGKTTLMKTCMGIIKPNTGWATLEGRQLSTISLKERARRIAYAPQNPGKHPFTVFETVLMGRHPRLGWMGIERTQDKRAAMEALERVELLEKAEQTVETLSGGERRRVLLARSLAQETDVIMMDEPTAELDLRYQLIAMNIAREEADAGAAVIVNMHDISLAARFCDSILVMFQGVELAMGAPEEVLNAATLRQAFSVEAKVQPSFLGSFPSVGVIRPSEPLRNRYNAPKKTKTD